MCLYAFVVCVCSECSVFMCVCAVRVCSVSVVTVSVRVFYRIFWLFSVRVCVCVCASCVPCNVCDECLFSVCV